jgi:flagellar basal-body rod protein FlgB
MPIKLIRNIRKKNNREQAMFLADNSTKSIDLIHRAMDASVLRKEALDNNIANATTPNYKRKDVTFQAELERALNSEKEEIIPFKTSRERHIPSQRVKDYKEVKAKLFTEFNTYQNNNGNSVDIDKEMMANNENTLYYNALAQRIASSFNKLKYILRSSS